MTRFTQAISVILFAFLSVFIGPEAVAQNKKYIGIKVGGNFSKTTRNEYTFKNPARFGLNPNREFGLVAHLPFSDSLSFQPEILVVKKGYQAFGIYNDTDGRTNKKSYEQWENTHLEVPLLLKFAVGKEKTKFFFAAGPAFSFWHSSNYNRDSTGTVAKEKYKVHHRFRQTTPKVIDTVNVNGKDEYIRVTYDSITVRARREVSAVFATGFHYKLKNSMLVFDIRYVYGFTNPFRYLEDDRALNYENDISPQKHPAGRQKEYNRRFSFTISYLFSFKNR